ncbi:M56 family metallopeptidase [Oscillospiraceae bacterium OttesenSCG-928-G22]|nr:M56 family metallopeptidase [Oscillospiraceae bacterium OttesenSCG-928-G22]
MLETIITSSALIAAIILVRGLFKSSLSRRLRYALWAIVLLRLLVPVQLLESPVSIMNAVDSERLEQAGYIMQEYDLPVFPLGTSTTNHTVETSTGNAAAAEPASPVPAPETEINWFTLSVTQIIFLVWLGGALAVAAWFAVVNARFKQTLKNKRKPLEAGDYKLPVYLVDMDASPCLFGQFRPAVYVTPKALEDEETLKYVLTHELTHYRHLDHVWAFLRIVCLSMYWFNPLVWVAACLSRIDCEQACDEAVVRQVGEDNRSQYGRAIVSMISSKPSPDMIICTATTMAAGKNSIKKRIAAIAANKKTALSALVAAVLLIAFAVGSTFTGADSGGNDDVTLYDCDGLSVAIPNEYIDQLIIQTADELADGMTLISVYEKASVDAAVADGYDANWFGWLFSFVRYDRVQHERYFCGESAGLYFFARDDDWYYGVQNPTDVQFYRSGDLFEDEGEYASWEALQDVIESVRDDFVTRNGLALYTDAEVRLGYTYDSKHQFLNYYPYYSVNGSKDEVYTLVLSQPATQGEGGIWCVERMADASGNTYLWFPATGKPALEYYAEVQAEHDAGKQSDHADLFSAAKVFLEESGYFESAVVEGSLELIGETEPPVSSADATYSSDWIYGMFDLGGGIDIGLTIGTDAFNTYTVTDRYYADRLNVLMSSYDWSLLDRLHPVKMSDDYWAEAPYYITLESVDTNAQQSLVFFADSNLVLFRRGDVDGWYELAYKHDGDSSIAADIRGEYDNQDVSYRRIMFYTNSAPETAASLFINEIYGKHLLGLAPGGLYSITDYELVDWELREVSEDETALVGWFEYAVIPENIDSPGLWAGNTGMGEGEYEGWLTMYREFVLQKQDDGYWHCIDFGTGGASLPD